jgi:general nucleoside transport system ATP-binding protein
MLRIHRVSKHFGALTAVDDVSLEIGDGEIVGLVGENGAGKTTLMRIAAGELAADAGTLHVDGPIGFVHQHFMLVNEFTVAENLELVIPSDADSIIRHSGIAFTDASRRVSELSVGEKSKVELIKALAKRPRVLILDEPTSVLTPAEAKELFDVMRRLAVGGTAVVFISHKIAEVLAVASRTVVMRGGRIVAEGTNMTADELARAMVDVGRAASSEQRAGLGSLPQAARRSPLAIGDLHVAPGEVVAIIGVAGNGQTELATRLREKFPDAAHIPEDRTRDGVVAEMTIAENIALRAPRWRPSDAAHRASDLIERYSIRAHSPQQRAGSLSGGNQQKMILARELERHPDLVVAAEPTRGLDIDATRFVHARLRDAAARGAAILLITSDLDEAFALSDAIHVIYRSRLSDRLTPSEAADRAARLMAGVA